MSNETGPNKFSHQHGEVRCNGQHPVLEVVVQLRSVLWYLNHLTTNTNQLSSELDTRQTHNTHHHVIRYLTVDTQLVFKSASNHLNCGIHYAWDPPGLHTPGRRGPTWARRELQITLSCVRCWSCWNVFFQKARESVYFGNFLPCICPTDPCGQLLVASFIPLPIHVCLHKCR